MADYEAENAKRILDFYIRQAHKKADLHWDSDNTAEVQGVVDDIIKAAVNEATAKAQAMLDEHVKGDEAAPKKVERMETLLDLLAGIACISTTRISQGLLEFDIRSWIDFKKRVEGR